MLLSRYYQHLVLSYTVISSLYYHHILYIHIIWGVPWQWGYPQSSSFSVGFSVINHPFQGTPHLWTSPNISLSTPILSYILYIHIYFHINYYHTIAIISSYILSYILSLYEHYMIYHMIIPWSFLASQDLHGLDLVTESWFPVKTAGEQPPPRANHASAVDEFRLYIFGGWDAWRMGGWEDGRMEWVFSKLKSHGKIWSKS